MSELPEFILKYAYLVVFADAFAEQIGLPAAAGPLLIGMGALSGSGDVSFPAIVITASIAALAADVIWYGLGWFHGRSALKLICRIALEPDYCVRRTEDAFERLGLWVFFPAKFIPGFNAAAVPLAGMTRTPFLQFVWVDFLAATVWAGAYITLGRIFSREIERVLTYVSRMGASMLIVVISGAAFYVVYKLHQRRKFLKMISGKRITPQELKAKMDAKEKVLIFDMRNHLDRTMDRVRIPGAFHVLPDHIEFEWTDIDADQEIVVYCNCPNEATSARVALRLQRKGLTNARPLEGGLDGWKLQNLPVERLD